MGEGRKEGSRAREGKGEGDGNNGEEQWGVENERGPVQPPSFSLSALCRGRPACLSKGRSCEREGKDGRRARVRMGGCLHCPHAVPSPRLAVPPCPLPPPSDRRRPPPHMPRPTHARDHTHVDKEPLERTRVVAVRVEKEHEARPAEGERAVWGVHGGQGRRGGGRDVGGFGERSHEGGKRGGRRGRARLSPGRCERSVGLLLGDAEGEEGEGGGKPETRLAEMKVGRGL